MASTFIFGFIPYSSGKTVISTALARGLLNHGMQVGVFKPRSGHNMWYQYDAFLNCKFENRLFCEDIIKLKAASKCNLPYEILNPIDALISPLNLEVFFKLDLIDWMYMVEGNIFHHLLAERYTELKDGKIVNMLLVNESNLKEKLVLQDRVYMDSLKNSVDKIILVRNVDEWNAYYRKLAPQCIYSCYSKLKDEYEILVVEGYNDALIPSIELLNDVDVVIGVSPGVAVLYEGNEFRSVVAGLMDLGRDIMSLKSKDVVKFLRKFKIIRIPALSKSDLNDYDRLAAKLEYVIDEVIPYF
ncbi:MAG: hypothetical protein NDF56_04005 [archaeon GB-1845-036]|nr:hypothetical protein [Candidatus Culexmicrobium thermophilum]